MGRKHLNVSLTAILILTAFGSAKSAAQTDDQTYGQCAFSTDALSFAGDALTQASCLTRFVEPLANLAPRKLLPPTLRSLVGKPVGIPASVVASLLLAARPPDIQGLADTLDQPLSRANNNARSAPMARYFVIHDTSSPNFKRAPFPDDINTSNYVNKFDRYPSGTRSKAHFFVDRLGGAKKFLDFQTPWRATKLELKYVRTPSKGLFIHIELVQPRRNNLAGIDEFAPELGFTDAQYRSLALLYVAASRRAGHWMIPAFHAAVDGGLLGGHDDPQRFQIEKFDREIGKLVNGADVVDTLPTRPQGDAAPPPSIPSAPLDAATDSPLRLAVTLYYTALESDYPSGQDASFRGPDGTVIAQVSSEFLRKASVEGSAKLSDGRVLNVAGKVNGEQRWQVVRAAYGLDAVGCPLIPYKSVAVGPDIKMGTRLLIPETMGMKLPDGTRHDGIWYAVDRGSKIVEHRIDLFLGFGMASMAVPRSFGLDHLQRLQVRKVGMVNGCARP